MKDLLILETVKNNLTVSTVTDNLHAFSPICINVFVPRLISDFE